MYDKLFIVRHQILEKCKDNLQVIRNLEVNQTKRRILLLAVCSLLVLFFASTSQIVSVKATSVAEEWGGISPINTYSEYQLENSTCNIVNEMFNSNYYSYDNYGTNTGDMQVYDAIGWIEDNNLYSTNFWVGDYHPEFAWGFWQDNNGWWWQFGPTTHENFYGASDVRDYDVWSAATTEGNGQSTQYFNFIWTCVCGGTYWDGSLNNENPGTLYGYYDLKQDYSDGYNNTGAVGMPYAWTGRADLSLNGYSNPSGDYCYIGWLNSSPGLCTPSLDNTNYNYAFFVYYVYYYLTGQYNGYHYSVNTALDMASQQLWGCSFGQSTIAHGYQEYDMGQWWTCQLEVLGNGDLTLPY